MKKLLSFFFDWSNVLPRATTDKQKVLRHAIRTGSVSIKNFGYLCGFRTRISELNSLGVPFYKIIKTDVNENGNSYYYMEHQIKQEDRSKAIDLYFKLLRNKG
jgi:hypothetical protein